MKRNIKNIEKLDSLKKDLSELQRMSDENMNKIDSIILKFEEIVRNMKGVNMEQGIDNLIQELTKARPDELSKEGLKLFNKINEIIDKNKELEEKNKKKLIEIICYQEELENSIPVSLVEEAIEEIKKKK